MTTFDTAVPQSVYLSLQAAQKAQDAMYVATSLRECPSDLRNQAYRFGRLIETEALFSGAGRSEVDALLHRFGKAVAQETHVEYLFDEHYVGNDGSYSQTVLTPQGELYASASAALEQLSEALSETRAAISTEAFAELLRE